MPMLATLALMMAPALAQDLDAGKRTYTRSCMACHGANGDGKGPAAAALKPPPTNFTQASFWKGRDDASIEAVIRTGKPGTSMMPFSGLSPKQLTDLTAYLRSLAPADASPAE